MRLIWVAALLGLALVACDDAAEPTQGDATPVLDAEVVVDAGPDAEPVDLGPDAAVGTACTWPGECPQGDCIEGWCVDEAPARCSNGASCPEGETCSGYEGGYWCQTPCEAEGSCPERPRPCEGANDCPRGMSCNTGRCINSCETDLDCAEGGYCYRGECMPYFDHLGGGAPVTGLAPGPGLHAGVGVVPLDYPVGVSAAGYGGRVGPRTPYAFALGGTDRVLERQDVRAVVLTDADETIVLLRLPLSWSTDYMMTLITEKVRALTIDAERPEGLDLTGKIVTFATHSHSQPARFWNLVPEIGFGAFGYGEFSPEMTERYTTSFAKAVHAALGDLQPARVGWTVLDEMDPERRIHSDRRDENPPLVDDRMMVLRVDDRDGRPLAAVINFAIHGTHMSTTWLTGDVAGAIEVVATQKLSAQAGRPVPVLFANGNAGDISPRGDDLAAPSFAKIQVVGHRVWPVFAEAFAGIETVADAPLEIVTRRVPIDYDRLGYDDAVPDFADRLGNPYRYGAFQCVAEGLHWEEPPHVDGALRCRINLEQFLGTPVVQLHRTAISAFRVGQLIVTTLPGEPTSSLGLLVSEQVEADARAAGWTAPRVVNFGYAQDHHFYLLLAEDWLHGGYEGSQNLWGWRLGAFLVEESRQTAAQLFTDEREPMALDVKPTWFPDLEDDTVIPTPSPDAGAVIDQPGDSARGALVTLRWTGGHPGADLPQSWLERREGEAWVPAERAGGVPWDDGGFESLLLYEGDFEADHTWAVRWELPFDLPLGTWRVVAAGRSGADAPYRAESAPFTVEAAALVARDVLNDEGTLAFKLNYPDGPSTDDGGAFEALAPLGHWFRLDTARSARGVAHGLRPFSFIFGPPLPIDAPVRVVFDQGGAVDAVAHDDLVGRDVRTARDADGNETVQRVEGWFSSRVEVAVPAGATQATVTDAHGNVATIALP